jgi:hypothetical protein
MLQHVPVNKSTNGKKFAAPPKIPRVALHIKINAGWSFWNISTKIKQSCIIIAINIDIYGKAI